MNFEEQKILEALQKLMSLQGSWADTYPGTPYVLSEQKFGLVMPPQGGSLYAMHHLINSLNRSNFFEGDRAKDSDVDSMIGSFKDFEIFKGVIASRDEKSMTLVIETTKSADETLAAIEKGIEAAQHELDRREKESADYKANVIAEFEKEKIGTIYSPENDLAFLKSYLKTKAESYFGRELDLKISDPAPAPEYRKTIYSDYGIEDTRPITEVRLPPLDNGHNLFGDFVRDVLPKTFTGSLAVHWEQMQDAERGYEYTLSGNPARLVKDIFTNDRETAIEVAQNVGVMPMLKV